MNLKLTKEKALELHRRMWSDMKDELGDCPSSKDREIFKYNWCKKHFPNDNDIECCCFLCEYARQQDEDCDKCLIKWDEYNGTGCVLGKIKHYSSPISAILALPAREDKNNMGNLIIGLVVGIVGTLVAGAIWIIKKFGGFWG